MAPARRAWHIITGEYPFSGGGVADYTRSIANGLGESNGDVHVWTPDDGGSAPHDPHVIVHRHKGLFSPAGLHWLSQSLDAFPGTLDVLIQYVPHAFGYRAMNVWFCVWAHRRRFDRISLMLHEVATPWGTGLHVRHHFLSAVTRLMAMLLISRADRLYVSVPAWNATIESFMHAAPGLWLPIPSNIPVSVCAAEAANARLQWAKPNSLLVGHFGTYGSMIAPLLAATLRRVLAKPDRQGLLLGRGSDHFVEGLCRESPELRGRLAGLGELSPEALAQHLSACDLVVQPFQDGVSTRRTTVMASLALGIPIVTNHGVLTEKIWAEKDAVELAGAPSEVDLSEAAERLIRDGERRRILRANSQALYRSRFSLERTLDILNSS